MRFEQLECLLAVDETGSFVGAAQKLFLTQQAVSMSMKQLEQEAALGRAYRKELEDEFVKGALALELGLKEAALRQMARALEAGQLMECRKALQQQVAKRFPPRVQLGVSRTEKAEAQSAFLI